MKNLICKLRTDINNGFVVRCKVVHIENSIAGSIGMTPKILENDPTDKSSIGLSKKGQNGDVVAFMRSFESCNAKYVPYDPLDTLDVRWGCIFYKANGRKAFEVYLDRLADEGYLNGRRIKVNGKLRSWFVNFGKHHNFTI